MEIASQIATWFIIFVIYSILGWCLEVLALMVLEHKVTNRGFLIGPICPIYGVGALIMALALRQADGILEVFIVSVLASAILEYLTSYLMEKIFRVRWWDYSHKPLNIRGRICAENLLYFGIMGVIVVYGINPLLLALLDGITPNVKIILACVLLAVILTDVAISLWLILKFRVTVGTVQRDATDEIAAKIKDILMERGKLNRRLAKAFPNMTAKRKTTSSKSKRPKATKPKSRR